MDSGQPVDSVGLPTNGDVEKSIQPSNPGSPRNVHGLAWVLVIISILSSAFLYSLDNTVVADIVPVIVNEFGSVAELAWLSVGFMIGGVSVVMPLGRLYGLFDAKWLYILSLVVFEASSALCGGSPNMNAMIVGRVFAGVGGIGMYIGAMTLISVNTSEKERPAYLSLIGLVWGIGTVLGPVVGGAFEKYNWRWAFYINLLIGAVFAPVYIFILPSSDPSPNTPLHKRVSDFDFIGTVLSIGAFVCIIMAISFGGTLYAWNSGPIIALFVVSGLITIAFGIQQKMTILTTTASRMFPVHFFKNKEALLLFVLAASCNACVFTAIYYIPIYFQFTRQDSALDSAVRLLPLIFLLSSMILLNGFLMSKLGYYQPWYIGGSVLALIASVLLSRIDTNTSEAAIYGFEVLLGVGTGAFVQLGYAVIHAVVDPADMYYAISFMMIAQVGGVALGLAIAGSVFVNTAQNALISILPDVPYSQLQQAISGTSSSFFNSLPDDTKAEALGAVIQALQKVFICAYAAAALALAASLFLRSKRVFVTAAAGA